MAIVFLSVRGDCPACCRLVRCSWANGHLIAAIIHRVVAMLSHCIVTARSHRVVRDVVVLRGQAPRFNVAAAPRVPGPGEYDSKNSLLKKSFNMVIVEEEERALIKKRL